MPRYFYPCLLVFISLASLVILFSYRTQSSSYESLSSGEFGGVSLRVEFATTTVARERGLSGRENIPDDYGILFVFPKDGYYGFWMKDTLVPLDIFWLDDKGHVVFIAQDVATSTYPNVFYPSAPARYVLETAAGFARRYTIATGTLLLLKNLERVSE